MRTQAALLNPKTSILKRHLYTGNVNSDMPGDSKSVFLHDGDASGGIEAGKAGISGGRASLG